MRVAVIGTGGVGGYFGARLALAGHEVTFVARGAHLDAIRKRGLQVEHETAPMHIANAQTTDDLSSIGPVDIAMVCTKLWDVEATAPALKPLVAGGGLAIPFQNGIDAPDMLRTTLGRDHVAGGIAYVAARISGPGVVTITGGLGRLRVGSFFGIGEHKINAFAEAGRGAGFSVDVADDIRRALWEKFAMFSAMSGCTALARQSIGVIRSDPDLRAMYERAIREAMAVGKAEGVTFADDYLDQQLAFADNLNPAMKASMANDLAAGHKLELPWLSGAVVRLGRQHGVPTPVHDTIYAALKPYANGVPH
ncbi:MAG TPA: 2-dehydropantoate 2-reductase [Casimicrobiaceae bacterium]|jgi:2-dehydropantoate 2-reductase